MALFALICIDKPDALALRMATRQAHFDYIGSHPGVLRLGGPFLDEAGEMAGSLMIIEAADLAAAEAFSAGDPYRKAGLFERVEVRPWRATFGEVP
jgi:uncharacterized protein YciI